MTFERVRNLIAGVLSKPEAEITLNTKLRDDLEADSLDIFRIVNDIEDEFNIIIEDAEQFETVADVINFIDKK